MLIEIHLSQIRISDRKREKVCAVCPYLLVPVKSIRSFWLILYIRGLQRAARGPHAALGPVLCGPGRVFYKIQCVMNIEA